MNGYCSVKTSIKKKKESKTPFIMPNNADFYLVPSDFEQDFNVVHHDDFVRGMYFWDTENSHIYLKQHGDLNDILNSCNHEALHHCLMLVQTGDQKTDEISMNIYQEHWAIQQVVWMLQDIMSDDFIDQHNDTLKED